MERYRPKSTLESLFWYSVFFCILTTLGLIAMKLFTSRHISREAAGVALGVPSFLSCVLGVLFVYKKNYGDEIETEALETTPVEDKRS